MRPPFDFFGGLFLSDHKHKSNCCPIAKLPLVSKFIIPLQQHVGVPCRPLVREGQTVKRGDLIGFSGKDLSVGVHASTSGTIQSIQKHFIAHHSNLPALCIIMDSDGRDDSADPQPMAWENHPLHEVRNHLQRMGIVGLGGGVFPSHIKMKTKIHTLIANGAECEPYITCDDLLMREEAAGILLGTHIVAQLLGAKKLILGIEDNKPEAIEKLKQARDELSSPIEIIVTPTKYPTGGAKQLIKCLTNVEIPHGKHTTDYGFQCFNVATLLAIYDALINGKPLTERIVTLSGNIAQGKNYRVRLGTPINELLKYHNNTLDCQNVVIGGPLMGFYVNELSSPIVKSTNCILIPAHNWNEPEKEMPCIRCGACAPVCPAKLQPHELYWFTQGKQLEKAQEYHLFDCIECGCCSYVCPSNIPLVQYYQYAKDEIRSHQLEKNLAKESKERFESRKQRQQLLEEDRIRRLSKQNKIRSQASDEEKRAVIVEAAKKRKEKIANREKSRNNPPHTSS
ncbi:electron transport complex subunit RsxC [Candidatus Ichthyocystis hellenicum]|uniref:electron transport complex subunit RsxC n=1 Tax=Candidatus Ichthyocystis hellenicum TaxID=1561003 RepID=UPI000A45529D|nr:electron transport complex subunit RsxC [Candidatus Ichthyocystis hellenicum]